MSGNDFGDAKTKLSAYQVLKPLNAPAPNDSIVSDLLFSLIKNNQDVTLENNANLLQDPYVGLTLPPASGQTVGTATDINEVMLIRKNDTTFSSTTNGFVLTTDLSSNTTNLVQPVKGYYKSRPTDASMHTVVSIDGSSTPYVLSTVTVDVINPNYVLGFDPRNTNNDNLYFKLHINETDDPTYTLAKVVFGQGNTTSTTKELADSKMNISFDNTLNAGALNLTAHKLTELDNCTNTIAKTSAPFDNSITLETSSDKLQTKLSTLNNFGIYAFDISNNTVDVTNDDTGFTNTTSRYAVSFVNNLNNYTDLPTSITTASFESWFDGSLNVQDNAFISVLKDASGVGYSLTTPSLDASYISIRDVNVESYYNDYMYTLADKLHYIDLSSNALTFTSLDASSNDLNNALFTASGLGETLSENDSNLNGEIRISVDASNNRTNNLTQSSSFSTTYITYTSENSTNAIGDTLKTTKAVSYNIYNVIPPQGFDTIYNSSTNYITAGASGKATLYSNGANSVTDALALDQAFITGDLSGCEAFYANITASRLLVNTANDGSYNSFLTNVSDAASNTQSTVYAEALGYGQNFFSTYKDYRFFITPKTTLADLSLNSAYGSWGLSKRNSDSFLKATQPSTKATNYFPRMADIRKVCNADSSLNITFKYATEPWINNINDSTDTLTVEYSLNGTLNSYVALTEADMSYTTISSTTSYANVTGDYSTITGPFKENYTFVKMTVVERYNVVAPFNLGGITNIDLTINNVESTNTSYLLFLASDNITDFSTGSNLHTRGLPRSLLQGFTIDGVDMSLVNEIITSAEKEKTITLYKKSLTPLTAGLYGTNGNISSSNINDWTMVVTTKVDIDPFSGTIATMDLSDNAVPTTSSSILHVQNAINGSVKFSLTPHNVTTIMNNNNKLILTEASGYYVNISSHLLTTSDNYVYTANRYNTIGELGTIFGTGHNNLNIFDLSTHTGSPYTPSLTVTKNLDNTITFTLKTTTGQTIMSYKRALDVINEIKFFYMKRPGLFWVQRKLNGVDDAAYFVAGSLFPRSDTFHNLRIETGVDVTFNKLTMNAQHSSTFGLNTDILEVKNVKQSGSTYSNTRLSERSNLSFTDPSAETITVPWWRGYYYNTGKTTSVHTINRSRMTCSVIIDNTSTTSIGPIFYNAALTLKAKNSVSSVYNNIPAQITSKWSLLPAAALNLTTRVRRIPITLETDTVVVTVNNGSSNLVSTPYTNKLAGFNLVLPNSNFKIRASTIHFQDAAPTRDLWKATYKVSPIYVYYTSNYTLKGAVTLNTVNWGEPIFPAISNTSAKQGIWFNKNGTSTTESADYPFKLTISPAAPTPGRSCATCYPPYLKAFTPRFDAAGSPDLSIWSDSSCVTRWSPILKQLTSEQINPFTTGQSGFDGSCFVPNYYLQLTQDVPLTSYKTSKNPIYFKRFSSTVKITETYNTASAANNVTNSLYVPIDELVNYNKTWQQDAAKILNRTFGISFELLTQELHTRTNMAVKFNHVIVPTKTYTLNITTSEQLNAKIYYYKYSSLTSDKTKLNLDIYKAEFAYSLNIPGVNLKMLQQIKLENPLSFTRISIPFYYTDIAATTNGFNIINFKKLIDTEFSTVSTIKTPVTYATNTNGWSPVTDSSFGWVCINALNATGQAALIDFVAVDNYYKNNFVRLSTPLIHKSTSSDGRYLSALNYYGEYSVQSMNTNLIKLNITDSSTTDYSTTGPSDTDPTNDNLSLLTQANLAVEFR